MEDKKQMLIDSKIQMHVGDDRSITTILSLDNKFYEENSKEIDCKVTGVVFLIMTLRHNYSRLVKIGELMFTADKWKKSIVEYSSVKEACIPRYHKKVQVMYEHHPFYLHLQRKGHHKILTGCNKRRYQGLPFADK
eukprot:15328883-Ditylum_brightwellii.AAC.1